jgi:hypothetical protein
VSSKADGFLQEVVHFSHGIHTRVTKTPLLSDVWHVGNFLSNEINGLKFRLKNRHVNEMARKQGKIRKVKTFSADLSPETVDFFPLAQRAISLQRGEQNRQLGGGIFAKACSD